uniref:Uncharacterized protein n=1 Tax=Panagrolaimus sp. JU765 TaxID=591449 RepID=A0AC34QM44_9BILA
MATKRPAEDDSIPDEPQEKTAKIDQPEEDDDEEEEKGEVKKNGEPEPDVAEDFEEEEDDPNEDQEGGEEAVEREEDDDEGIDDDDEAAETSTDLPEDVKEGDSKLPKLPENLGADSETSNGSAEPEKQKK